MIVMEEADMKLKGFSLIELMVVLAIITIIATASVPQIQMWTARNRGLSAVSTIISEFSKAKSIAGYSVRQRATGITGLRPQTALHFTNNSISILQRDTMTVGSWNISEAIKTIAMPRDVEIDEINLNSVSTPQTILFTSTGMLKTAAGALSALNIGGDLQCGGVDSPLNGGRRALLVTVVATVTGSGGIWYRIEMDETGNYAICSMTNVSDSTAPVFSSGANAGYIEL